MRHQREVTKAQRSMWPSVGSIAKQQSNAADWRSTFGRYGVDHKISTSHETWRPMRALCAALRGHALKAPP
jgi:hypothetical protein